MAHRAGSRCGRLPAPPRPCSELRASPTSCPPRRAGSSVRRAWFGRFSRGARRRLPRRERGAVGSAARPRPDLPASSRRGGGGGGRGGGTGKEGEHRRGGGGGTARAPSGGAEAALCPRRAKVSFGLRGLGACPSHERGPGSRCVRLGTPCAVGFAGHETLTPSPSPAQRLQRLPGGRPRTQGLRAPGGAPRTALVNFITPAPLCSSEITRLPQPGVQDRVHPHRPVPGGPGSVQGGLGPAARPSGAERTLTPPPRAKPPLAAARSGLGRGPPPPALRGLRVGGLRRREGSPRPTRGGRRARGGRGAPRAQGPGEQTLGAPGLVLNNVGRSRDARAARWTSRQGLRPQVGRGGRRRSSRCSEEAPGGAALCGGTTVCGAHARRRSAGTRAPQPSLFAVRRGLCAGGAGRTQPPGRGFGSRDGGTEGGAGAAPALLRSRRPALEGAECGPLPRASSAPGTRRFSKVKSCAEPGAGEQARPMAGCVQGGEEGKPRPPPLLDHGPHAAEPSATRGSDLRGPPHREGTPSVGLGLACLAHFHPHLCAQLSCPGGDSAGKADADMRSLPESGVGAGAGAGGRPRRELRSPGPAADGRAWKLPRPVSGFLNQRIPRAAGSGQRAAGSGRAGPSTSASSASSNRHWAPEIPRPLTHHGPRLRSRQQAQALLPARTHRGSPPQRDP
eukprot:XP_023984416.1 uncharacterized protein LOC112066216 [Physeter catodon]